MPPKASAAGGANKKLPAISTPASKSNQKSAPNTSPQGDSKLPKIKGTTDGSPKVVANFDPALAALDAQIAASKKADEEEVQKRRIADEELARKATEEALLNEKGNGNPFYFL